MSVICLLFASVLAASSCPPSLPDEVRLRGEANRLRPDVEAAVLTANDALIAAGETFRLVPSWRLGDRGMNPDEVIVYLTKSTASIQAQAEQRRAMEKAVDAIGSDFSSINVEADGCDDLDDCVADLYPETTVDTVFFTLNRMNGWELALSLKQCRCIILVEQDLELYRIVFGAEWDRYILLTRYDSADEFQKAVESGQLPDVLLDGEPVSLPAMLVFLMLHEMGHLSTRPFSVPEAPDWESLRLFLAEMSQDKREELRADSFASSVLGLACFGQNPSGLLLQACLAPTTLSMLTYAIAMKGKSKEARCLRYLDAAVGYPNWLARWLLLDFQTLPDSPSARNQLSYYFAVRQGLLTSTWIHQVPICARTAALSLVHSSGSQ